MSSLRLWVARGSLVSLAPTVEYGSRFLRTALLSRLLGPHEFGASVAIATVVSIAALVTDLSLDKFVLLHSRDDRSNSLAAAHVLTILRGASLSLILFLVARPTAALFEIPQFSNSFAVAALYPLIASLANLSIKQIQQNFDYFPEVTAQILTHISAATMAIVAAYYFRDHRAILASILTEAFVYTVMSHLLAKDSYYLSSDWFTLRRAAAFGTPLLLNGLGLAAILQLDRMLIGSWLGVEALGQYAVILSLAILPTSLIYRVFGSMATPSLLAQRNLPSHDTHYALLMFFSDFLGASYSLFIALCLDWLMPIIFGHAYHVTHTVHLIIVLTVFLRILRGTAPTSYFLVAGKTGTLARLNILSGSGLIFSLILLQYWLNMEAVLFGLLIGELVSNVFLFLGSPTSTLEPKPRQFLLMDLALSVFTVTLITVALFLIPEPALGARAIILILGLFGLGAQFLLAFHNHQDLDVLFRRTSPHL